LDGRGNASRRANEGAAFLRSAIHRPSARPNAIPGFSTNADSTAAAAKVAAMAAQNRHWPFMDSSKTIIGMWRR
jgi:hypothetical protein